MLIGQDRTWVWILMTDFWPLISTLNNTQLTYENNPACTTSTKKRHLDISGATLRGTEDNDDFVFLSIQSVLKLSRTYLWHEDVKHRTRFFLWYVFDTREDSLFALCVIVPPWWWGSWPPARWWSSGPWWCGSAWVCCCCWWALPRSHWGRSCRSYWPSGGMVWM